MRCTPEVNRGQLKYLINQLRRVVKVYYAISGYNIINSLF